MTTTPTNINKLSASGGVETSNPRVSEVRPADAASVRKKFPPRIMKRKAFALWSLIFFAALLGIFLFQRAPAYYFRDEFLGIPMHRSTTVLVLVGLVGLGVFVWYAVAPRVRDIGILGVATWVVIALGLLLPETTASWAVLLLYPSYVSPVFGQKT